MARVLGHRDDPSRQNPIKSSLIYGQKPRFSRVNTTRHNRALPVEPGERKRCAAGPVFPFFK